MDLRELVSPAHTVILTQECQKGVIGPESVRPALYEEARDAGVLGNMGRLVKAGRAAGCNVIHAIAAHRPDLRGANHNARLFTATEKHKMFQLLGTPLVEVIDEIGCEPTDLVSTRLHGISPIAGTDVGALLTNLGAQTVIVVGVSTNVGVTCGVFDAVNLGYQTVVARDAITGFPTSYTEVVIENSLSFVATITTTDDLVAAWEASTP
jgi:nicotinamidase-related amidase